MAHTAASALGRSEGSVESRWVSHFDCISRGIKEDSHAYRKWELNSIGLPPFEKLCRNTLELSAAIGTKLDAVDDSLCNRAEFLQRFSFAG